MKYIDDSKELIGTSESIVSFWEDFKGDVKQYAAQKSMKIDTKHKLFYNNGSLYAPCVIRCGDPYFKKLEILLLCMISFISPIHFLWEYLF